VTTWVVVVVEERTNKHRSEAAERTSTRASTKQCQERTAWSDVRNRNRLVAGDDNIDNFDVEHKLSTQSVNVVICAALRCTKRL
jgi:hypothetical protein